MIVTICARDLETADTLPTRASISHRMTEFMYVWSQHSSITGTFFLVIAVLSTALYLVYLNQKREWFIGVQEIEKKSSRVVHYS